jgi:hypothetical protein
VVFSVKAAVEGLSEDNIVDGGYRVVRSEYQTAGVSVAVLYWRAEDHVHEFISTG